MEPYRFYGEFKIVTDCADLEKIQEALKIVERHFGDVLEITYDKRGYMRIQTELTMELPLHDMIEEEEEIEDIEDEGYQ